MFTRKWISNVENPVCVRQGLPNSLGKMFNGSQIMEWIHVTKTLDAQFDLRLCFFAYDISMEISFYLASMAKAGCLMRWLMYGRHQKPKQQTFSKQTVHVQNCFRTDRHWYINFDYQEVRVIFESEQDKTNRMTCVPSEDSNQFGRAPSLISLRCPHEGGLGPKHP